MPLGQIATLVMVNAHGLSYSQYTCQAIDFTIINTYAKLLTLP